jgi:energy-coupling factor transport system ATP-binding protein
MEQRVITIKNLEFAYADSENIFKSLNLEIYQGEWISILGSNGSGKSTLFKLILNLLKPNSGQVLVDGRTTAVFQNPDEQFFGSTVEDDLAFMLENQETPVYIMHEKVSQQLEKFELKEFALSDPQTLSGGQKQKVAIASALIGDADILLFDEVTSMLDKNSKKEILTLIRQLHKNPKLTIISITHDASEAMLTDRTIVIDNGEIVVDSTPQKILLNKKLSDKYKLPLPLEKQFPELPRELLRAIEND